MPRLTVKFPDGTKTVPLADEALTIGRTNDNRLPLDDAGVSRRHAQILFVGKGYEVVDLGSRNGTKVNGQKVPRAILKAGDVVTIGAFDLVFEEDATAAGGLELEELDLGAAQAGAPAASNAAATMAFQAATGAVGECVLRVIDGEKKGAEIALKGPRTTFGRRSSNTVSFADAGVSGVHCEISREPNGYVLRDLGSTNGTLVDGEAVVETLLRHNMRIRIGAQRLLFVDPTVADIESTLAAGDEASEWGLMRGEIDVTAARGRGGRGVLVAAAVVVVAAAAGGWFVMKSSAKSVEVATVKDNRIPDPSFEEGVVRWFSPEEEGANARIAGSSEKPRAASGVQSLEVLPQGEGAGRVELSQAAQGGTEASVTPDGAYEVSVKVGGGSGALIVVWASATRPGLVREVSTPIVEGGGGWPVARAVVAAPANATSARIQLAAFGGRPATFDDVVFRRAEGSPPPALESGNLRARIDAGGFLEAERQGEVLITQGGVAPAVDTPLDALLGAVLAAPPAHSGAALTASGTLPGGGGFDTKVEAVGGGAAITCVPKGAAGAFTFTCPSGLARGAMTLVLEKSALVVPEGEAFQQEGVRKIIVGVAGGPEPFVLSAPEKTAGFSFSSRRTARGLRVQLAPPAGALEGGGTVRLSVDLSQEDKAAREALTAARDEETKGRKGAAAALYQRVALEFHYLPAYRDPAAKAAESILKDAGARLQAAEREARSARRFRSVPDLLLVIEAGTALHREFEDHAIGTKAKDLADGARKALEEVRQAEVEVRVDRLYRRAQDYAESGQPALALVLLNELLRIAPSGDDHRDRAEKQVVDLRRAMEEQQQNLYGTRR